MWSVVFAPVLRERARLHGKRMILRLGSYYPASSWFLLRQTREKPLRATVRFSIEHARVRHAPHDALDVNFNLKCLYKRMQVSHQKRWQNRKIQTFVVVLFMSSLWSTHEAEIWGFLALSRAGLLSSLNTTLQTTIDYSKQYEFGVIRSKAGL